MEMFPSCERDVRGHSLKIHFNTFFSSNPPGYDRKPLQRFRAALVIVRRHSCGRWGHEFRMRGEYYSTETCPVCRRKKTATFTYAELKPLLPPEWFNEEWLRRWRRSRHGGVSAPPENVRE